MPVAVEGQGHAVAGDDLLEQEQVAVGVLVLPEQGEGHRPGGVVHGPDEGEAGAAPLQPVVLAPIDLQQHPLLRVALPAPIALTRATAARTVDSPRQQDPSDGGARQADALPLRQQLGQMRVVKAGVTALGQGQHLCPRPRAGGGRRLPATVAVRHGGGALLSIRRQQSPRVATAHAQQAGRFSH